MARRSECGHRHEHQMRQPPRPTDALGRWFEAWLLACVYRRRTPSRVVIWGVTRLMIGQAILVDEERSRLSATPRF